MRHALNKSTPKYINEGAGVAKSSAEKVLATLHVPLSMPNNNFDIGFNKRLASVIVRQPKRCVRALCTKLDVQGCELLHTSGYILARPPEDRKRGPEKDERAISSSHIQCKYKQLY